MKKVISVLMAIAMLAALMVPAFALDKTLNETTASDTAEVKTNYDNLEATGGYYTVTYPAETTIAWGTEETTIQYNVTTQLVPTATLNVTVKQDNTAMKSADETQLPYTLTGNTDVTGIDPFVNNDYELKINVTDANWKSVPVDNYSDTLTFEASIVNP